MFWSMCERGVGPASRKIIGIVNVVGRGFEL